MIKHLNKKFPCDKVEKINDNYDDKIKKTNEYILKITKESLKLGTKCLFCELPFTKKCNLKRHIDNSCDSKKELLVKNELFSKEKIKLIKDKNKNIEKQLSKKIKEDRENFISLKNDIKLLTEKISNNKENNITINNNNNTQNNIIMINPFGKEDLSHLSVEDYKKFLNGFFPGFLKYIEKVHFDENAPQNHNICISNLRSKYLTIHDGDKWVTKMKDDILERFINKKHNQLIDKCEHLEETKQIDKKIIDNFEEFCESFNDKEAQKTTKNNIVTMIYDNKNKIKLKNKIKISKSDLNKLESIEKKIIETNDNDIKPKKKKKIN